MVSQYLFWKQIVKKFALGGIDERVSRKFTYFFVFSYYSKNNFCHLLIGGTLH